MLSGTLPFLEKTTSFAPKTVYGWFQNLPFIPKDKEIEKLKNENLELVSKLLDQEKLMKENAALLSQFQTEGLGNDSLLPAQIVGAPGFVPGVTEPEEIILNKGERDNVRVGSGVVFQNNLVGKITKVSYYLSKADLVTNPSIALPVQTFSGVLGVVRGEGEDKITLENVLPSEHLKIDDLILTKGDLDINGIGIPPNLVVGRIESIEKIPAAIFQKAELKSLLDFDRLSVVFIVVER